MPHHIKMVSSNEGRHYYLASSHGVSVLMVSEKICRWWRCQMKTFSALLAICAGNSPVTGEFPAQRPVTRIFDVFFDLRLNKWLSEQSWGWWFVTPSHLLWRHCNVRNENWSCHIPQREIYRKTFLLTHQWIRSYLNWILHRISLQRLVHNHDSQGISISI